LRDLAQYSPLLLCFITVFFGALASLSPLSPVEPVLVAIALVAPRWLLLPLILLAAASHMSTKTIVFLGGQRLERAFSGRRRERFEAFRARLTGRPMLQRGTLFVSSVVGLPPFYVVTALCGTLKMPLREFLMVGTTGRTIRFAALMLLPQLFRAAPLAAQTVPPAVTVSGAGVPTYVLISGMVGGVAGYRRLERELVAAGARVVVVDPYQLSIDSADVSFDAIARRVAAELAVRGISGARVVGHAHGAGVAIRLAANAPDLVRELYLLDAGALPMNRSTVFGASLRFIPLFVKLPGARAYVRRRYLDGLRDVSGNAEWLDDATASAYVDPVLANIDRVIAMAVRLSVAPEPEPVASVVSRIHAPITLILGGIPSLAGPHGEELTTLTRLGAQVQRFTVMGVGHFPHEEAPAEVARLLGAQVVVVAKKGGAR
jgi:pimeloyl-ACP methyl ester carboxylesterase/membrane protein YqaA with SNARE-associated domain